MQVLFILGIALCLAAIALLALFAFKSLKIKSIDVEKRGNLTTQLLAINFGAIALATFGLILVFFSLKFGS